MDDFVFHHIGIVVFDLRTATANLENLFAYKMMAGPFDDAIQKVSVCFLGREEGDPLLELVAPLGPDSPLASTARKRGGLYHICYQVPKIDTAIAGLIEKGCFLLSGPVQAAAFEMKKIAWLMTGTKLLVELLEA